MIPENYIERDFYLDVLFEAARNRGAKHGLDTQIQDLKDIFSLALVTLYAGTIDRFICSEQMTKRFNAAGMDTSDVISSEGTHITALKPPYSLYAVKQIANGNDERHITELEAICRELWPFLGGIERRSLIEWNMTVPKMLADAYGLAYEPPPMWPSITQTSN